MKQDHRCDGRIERLRRAHGSRASRRRPHGLRRHARNHRTECRAGGKCRGIRSHPIKWIFERWSLDVANDASVNAGIASIMAEAGRLDVIVHNAGHMSFGPAEAFTARAVRRTLRRERIEHRSE